MLNNKYDFTFFVQAKNCNPNGDPDMGNLPRIDEETMHGFITDVAIKRRIRDYIQEAFSGTAGMDIIIRDGINVNKAIAETVLSAGNVNSPDVESDGKKGKKKSKVSNKDVTASSAEACKRFFDVRTFGGVLSTGLNAGQIKGPVQFEFGQSLDPIFIKDITITRVCYTKEVSKPENLDSYDEADNDMKPDEKRTMGRKQFISYGLYQVNGYVSAMLARKTGFSEEDLSKLFEAILNMYNYAQSASKSGMSVISPIIVFKHVGSPDTANLSERTREACLGCAPAYKLHNLIKIQKKSNVEFPRDYSDYDITIDTAHLPKGIEIGFKHTPFEDIVWGNLNDSWINTTSP